MFVYLVILTFVNCVSVKWATKVQDVFTVAKVFALVLVVLTGIVVLAMGNLSDECFFFLEFY